VLRGAIVGFGFVAERAHLHAYAALGAQRFRIAAVADVSAARRAAAERAIPGVKTYADHASLLAAEGHALDFVDIATPPARHAEVAHAALDHGLHVLCETPLATTAADARSLLLHAGTAQRVLYPCHDFTHAPVITRVRDLISARRIGSVRLVTLQTFFTTHAHGVPEWRPDWRRERFHAGGGVAMDQGGHAFYRAIDWLGAYPTGISATTSRRDAYDTEDNLSCSIRFPTGVASAHLSWTAGAHKEIYSIHGDRGAITVGDEELELTSRGVVTRERISWSSGEAGHVHRFSLSLEDFARAIAEDVYVGDEVVDAARCVELIEAAYASARKGGREVLLGARRANGQLLTTGAV
jgi:predicted dehydrogenase